MLLSTLPTLDGGRYVVGTVGDVRQRVDLERDSTLVHHVLNVVSGSSGTSDAISMLLEVVATTVGWDAAGLWEPAPGTNVLRCQKFWSSPDRPPDAMTAASMASRFAPGVGLPGRVWTDVDGAWVV